jgi:hypothetical protein
MALMSRRTWDELAGGVRHAIEAECGPVGGVVDAPAGSNCDFAATLRTPTGPVFVKAVREDHEMAWMLGNEARLGRHLPDVAPSLLWHLTTEAWIVNGYEHVDGRHADLAPGSPDLPLIANVLNDLADTAGDWPVLPVEDRWTRHTKTPGLLAGTALVHTDPVSANLLVTSTGIRLVDWAWPALGAPWIDTGLLVMRLVDAGHTQAEAERWAAGVPAWSAAGEAAISEFVSTIAAMWQRRAQTRPAPHRQRLSRIATAWERQRIGLSGGGPF